MKYLLTILLLTISVVLPAQAQTRYISDSLFTYMHSGPSNKYRIIGSINSGEKVNMLEADKATGYSKVSDNKGRTGWVKSDFIAVTPSLKIRLPKLEKELTQVKSALNNAQATATSDQQGLKDMVASKTQQINDLEKTNRSINEQLNSAQVEMRQLRARLDTQKDDLLMRWFTYGGIVAGIGLLLGLLLPHIIPRKKKQNGGW
ncbi:SH3 domain-containing protein [Vibrio sp. SS-MA-C1-2]|uniref:TIGR04211 family SH3 domain-containing protein n=1 Tax=Vibrio sp. SS-MA-C1-2 TaxID=2908646 RepID=UPI001F1DEEC2|nr:TIGR04211 family SH3 domain-containing protein [Vibrio sp. SS-MA-C1-2]UJF19111.1 SH3 domain-containing protein [Vibrio sp. SS-MA-C1-2]